MKSRAETLQAMQRVQAAKAENGKAGGVRKKLTDRQFELYRVAQVDVFTAQHNLQQAQQRMAQWAELVFDHHELPRETVATVDETTRELVIGQAPGQAQPPTQEPPAGTNGGSGQ